MKEFIRENQLLSLCGLNCGLCPMFLGHYCGGCGNGNQSCKIAACSLRHGRVAYCYECECYPCENYWQIDEFDSFITHKRRKADLEKAKSGGVEAYNREQTEKIALLHWLLDHCNDGRRKTFFCVAVNLLELPELQQAMAKIRTNQGWPAWPLKEKSVYVVDLLQTIAKKRNLELKLNKKKQKQKETG